MNADYTPNWEQINSGLRNVIAVVGGYLIGKGYLTADQLAAVGGLLLAIGPVVWSFWKNRQQGLMDSAKVAIKADPSVVGTKPVVDALREAGAEVNTSALPFKAPAK